MQLLNYYMPRLKKQLIFYPVIAVVLYLLIFVTLRWEGVIIIGAMVSNILNLMLVFGALIFASRSGMEIDTALPVDWRQKATFILLYTFIAVPLLIAVPMGVCYLCTKQWMVVNPFISGLTPLVDMFMTQGFIWLSVVTTLLPMAVCLYCVMAIKHNRIILSVVWTIVVVMVESFIGGIIGGLTAFRQGFEDGFNGVERQSDELPGMVVTQIDDWSIPLTIFFVICTIFVIVKACQVIKNRQI
ncbi:MAG: hypothetical protein DBY35_02170 [Bacteroidales bacterium]|nr:MAG: hypothetical protein DBY35_02170 [Bacteroidales bacterium]